jgi:hypothetical protein
LTAVAQFGPDGITGRLTAGPYQQLSDAVIGTPGRPPTPVHLGPNGDFSARSDEILLPGQYLPDVVLTDRQQKRVAIFPKLFAQNGSAELENLSSLYVWSQGADLPFALEPGARTIVSTLLAIPLEFVRPPADTQVSVPKAFVSCQRLLSGKLVKPTLESAAGVDMHLRFQVPPSVLPLKLERARLLAKQVRTPQRHVTVSGFDGDKPVELSATEGQSDALSVVITKEPLLKLDNKGGLHLNLAVGELPEQVEAVQTGADKSRWCIESIELEVSGRTLPVQ